MTPGSVTNIEFKARVDNHDHLRTVLEEQDARYTGRDHQVDTYFSCEQGRLKIREGAIESALIFYDRPDDASAKRSNVILHEVADARTLKAVLSAAYGVDVVVEKFRDIYFVDNVKIHLDDVPELGLFVEVEAIDQDGSRSEAELRRQCHQFQALLGIGIGQMEARSYADLTGASEGCQK